MKKPLHLFAYEGVDQDSLEAVRYALRPLNKGEAEELQDATLFLRFLTYDSPYETLLAAETHFDQAAAALEGVWTNDRASWESRVDDLHTAFKNWLDAVVAFDDDTQNALARHLGPRNEMALGFKGTLAAEFERNLAYRLAVSLQPVSARERVVNDVRIELRQADDGTTIDVVRLGLVGPDLAARFPRPLAAIRDELQSIDHTLDLVAVVRAATGSCERALATLLVLLRHHILAASELLEAAHGEALRAGATAAVVMPKPRPKHPVPQSEMHPVDVERAWEAQRLLGQAEQFLAHPGPVIGPADLRQDSA